MIVVNKGLRTRKECVFRERVKTGAANTVQSANETPVLRNLISWSSAVGKLLHFFYITRTRSTALTRLTRPPTDPTHVQFNLVFVLNLSRAMQ